MTDLTDTIDWDAIDFSQVIAEDRSDDERNMDFLSKPRAGVQFVPVVEDDEVVEGCAAPPRPATIKAVVTAYHELIAVHGPENVIVVAPFKDKPAGVRELNDAIRVSLGYGADPCVGDFLMITKNSFDRTRLNGERYRAVIVDVDKKVMKAKLIGAPHTIILEIKRHDKGPCKDVDWGYVATVHKYQGSEAAATVVVIPSGTLKLMRAVGGEQEPWFCDRSFVYTACSRPKLSLVLIGDPKDICEAIKLNRSDRVTALSRMSGGAKRSRRVATMYGTRAQSGLEQEGRSARLRCKRRMRPCSFVRTRSSAGFLSCSMKGMDWGNGSLRRSGVC